MKIKLIECCEEDSKGSVGFEFIRRSVASLPFVEFVEEGQEIELCSIHHCTGFKHLASLPSLSGVKRIVGGHVMANNCRPAIPFADLICLGEGETWIKKVLKSINEGQSIAQCGEIDGSLVCGGYDRKIPEPVWEDGVPSHQPYLNRCGEGHDATWYIEIARGCPFSCHYCELGNTVKYRQRSRESVVDALNQCDLSLSKKVTLFAPDEASHPHYGDFLTEIEKLGMQTMFGSMRVDSYVNHALTTRKNMLIRVGIDGLTEETRFQVGKKITDKQIVDFFRFMTEQGHSNFKIFMVVGYPWETGEDFREFKKLWEKIASIPRIENAHVRIKITPLIPQPSTPLADAKAKYDAINIQWMETWINNHRPKKEKGWFIEQDGRTMAMKNWIEQCRLTKGDEVILL